MADRGRSPLNVVVGPQRTGSTYLHALLSAGNSFHVPLVKEINYLLSLSNWSEHFAPWAYEEFLRKLLLKFDGKENILENLSPYNRLRLGQLSNFTFSKESYLELFNTPFPGFDISPSYCAIDEQSWIRIKSKFSLNIFVIVREPIARCWSALNMYAWPLKKTMPNDFMPEGNLQNIKEIDLLLDRVSDFSKEVILCRYSTLIPMLHRVFGDSLTIIDFDDLIKRPWETLSKLRELNGVLALDRMERYRDIGDTLNLLPGKSAKNSDLNVAAPSWFIDWHREMFAEERDFFDEYKQASNLSLNSLRKEKSLADF